jgi:aspartate aminotransferase-like enzyme
LQSDFHSPSFAESPDGYNVLAPGPVNLHPKIRQALALPMIHHRTPEFDAILARTLSRLKSIFATEESVYILTATGSGGMEALLVNVLSPGDLVLGVDSGKFGERWCEMAKTYGARLHRLKVPWGEAVKTSNVAEFLQKHPETKIVMCQACETSTGVSHPIRELGHLIQNYPDTLFLVDGITAVGAMPLPMDEWAIDGIVGGSQKAFMLPTGLSFVSFSKKAAARFESASTPRFYFDIRKEKAANLKGETFFSSNVSLIRALDVALEIILEKGFTKHLEEIDNRARFTRHFAPDLGLSLYSHSPSNSVTALNVPAGMDSQKVRSLLEKNHHITVMGGQDEAKGKILRVGHMGYISWKQMFELMLRLRETLLTINPDLKFAKSESQLELEMRAWIQHVET